MQSYRFRDRRQQKQAGNGASYAVSGGVDSSVASMLIHRAIGDRLACVS